MHSTKYVPKILFIKGVFKKDCVMDDFFEKKIMENIQHEFDDVVIYNKNADNVIIGYYTNNKFDRIPHFFTNLDTWIDKTNVLCWYCTLPFNNAPIFIPRVIEPNVQCCQKDQLSMTTLGLFCSFGCAHEFIQTRVSHIVDRTEYINKLKFLYKFINNKQMPNYESYPDPLNMRQYGGNISVEEFRKIIAKFKAP